MAPRQTGTSWFLCPLLELPTVWCSPAGPATPPPTPTHRTWDPSTTPPPRPPPTWPSGDLTSPPTSHPGTERIYLWKLFSSIHCFSGSSGAGGSIRQALAASGSGSETDAGSEGNNIANLSISSYPKNLQGVTSWEEFSENMLCNFKFHQDKILLWNEIFTFLPKFECFSHFLCNSSNLPILTVKSVLPNLAPLIVIIIGLML